MELPVTILVALFVVVTLLPAGGYCRPNRWYRINGTIFSFSESIDSSNNNNHDITTSTNDDDEPTFNVRLFNFASSSDVFDWGPQCSSSDKERINRCEAWARQDWYVRDIDMVM